MPTRTVLPTISITWTTTSSPIMIFSPIRRVMSSMVPPWIQLRERVWSKFARLRGGDGVGREERCAHRRVAALVDDLVALAVGDQDRRAQVGVKVGQLGAGADGDPHGHVGRVGGDRR